MRGLRWTGMAALILGVAVCLWDSGRAAEPVKKADDLQQKWDRIVDKGVNYLKGSQSADGTWSNNATPGVTGIALTGLLQSGKVSPKDPVADKALKYIESLIDPKEGHIAGKENVHLQN